MYEWKGRLAIGTEYKVLDAPEDLKTKVTSVYDDNGYIILQSSIFFKVLLYVSGVQVARLPAVHA